MKMTQQVEERRQESQHYQVSVLVYFAGFMPLILLFGAYNRGELGFNPVETILHRTGADCGCLPFTFPGSYADKLVI